MFHTFVLIHRYQKNRNRKTMQVFPLTLFPMYNVVDFGLFDYHLGFLWTFFFSILRIKSKQRTSVQLVIHKIQDKGNGTYLSMSERKRKYRVLEKGILTVWKYWTRSLYSAMYMHMYLTEQTLFFFVYIFFYKWWTSRSIIIVLLLCHGRAVNIQ